MAKNTLITSRPGIGKTQKAIEYYIDKVSSGVNGVFVTLEMSDVTLMDRILKTCVDKNIILSKNSYNAPNTPYQLREFFYSR